MCRQARLASPSTLHHVIHPRDGAGAIEVDQCLAKLQIGSLRWLATLRAALAVRLATQLSFTRVETARQLDVSKSGIAKITAQVIRDVVDSVDLL